MKKNFSILKASLSFIFLISLICGLIFGTGAPIRLMSQTKKQPILVISNKDLKHFSINHLLHLLRLPVVTKDGKFDIKPELYKHFMDKKLELQDLYRKYLADKTISNLKKMINCVLEFKLINNEKFKTFLQTFNRYRQKLHDRIINYHDLNDLYTVYDNHPTGDNLMILFDKGFRWSIVGKQHLQFVSHHLRRIIQHIEATNSMVVSKTRILIFKNNPTVRNLGNIIHNYFREYRKILGDKTSPQGLENQVLKRFFYNIRKYLSILKAKIKNSESVLGPYLSFIRDPTVNKLLIFLRLYDIFLIGSDQNTTTRLKTFLTTDLKTFFQIIL